MTTPEPRRWLDTEGGLPASVSEALSSARLDEPSAAQLSALKAGVTSAVAAAPAASGLSLGVKGLLGLAVVAAAGGTAWFALRDTRVETPAPVVTAAPLATPQGTVEEAPPVVPPTREALPPPAPIRPALPRPPPAPVAVEARAAEPKTVEAPPPPPPPADPVDAELALFDEMRAARRANDFQTVLTLADRHAREFAHGTLVPERQLMAMEALKALGRNSEANSMGSAFLDQWPTSPLRSKVQALMTP